MLSIRPFRRLWIALSLSSLGDWLALLALSALAADLAGHHQAAQGATAASAAQGAAVAGVWLTSLLPALLLGPLAGAFADRFDRRTNMIVGDVLRAALYLSIPLNLRLHVVNELTWILTVQFLASCASLFWTPAKDATVPNLVPPDKLEQANQVSLLSTYGTAPIAGLVFAGLATISGALGSISHHLQTNQVNLALYFNVGTFVVSALTVYWLREIPRRGARGEISAPSVIKTILDGWRYIRNTQVVRGIVIGLSGAFAAAGVIVGLGYVYITDTLGAGKAGWGIVFSAIFVGLALGMFVGLRILHGFSRRRLFGLSIAFAGVLLGILALVPNFIVVTILVVLIGASAGVAYVTGYTIIGREVDDDTRGRTFAFLQSAIRVIMFLLIAAAGLLGSALTSAFRGVTGWTTLRIGTVSYGAVGDNLVLLLAAATAIGLGIVSYRQMDDRSGVPLLTDLSSVVRGAAFAPVPGHPNGHHHEAEPKRHRGLFLAFEGGEGAGKSTQARLLAIWLREQGYDVVATHEPGATKIGMRLRALLLDTAHTGLAPQAEALMYASDRAEHVSAVIRPALERGAVVVTDRYVDSSLAYQGAGRQLPVSEIARLNEWATGGLMPDLTILLDLPATMGLSRRARSADRLEAEPADFHHRVRSGFLNLANAEPSRYLVIDASRDQADISREIKARVRDLLPDPVPETAEETTGSFPAVTE